MAANKVLLQTTIPFVENDWHIGRFSKLHEHLASIKNDDGSALVDVVARNREEDENGDDVILSRLDEMDFDQLWLFAVDTGSGLSVKDCEAITRFRRRGGGIFSTRDHQDLGISLCTLGGVGAAHYFHSRNLEPDQERHSRDDADNLAIDFPNYHSGRNGDPRRISTVEPLHELLRRPNGEAIEFFPAHPHEGSVGVPEGDDSARVIATGKSLTTGHDFNLIVAFEKGIDRNGYSVGRAIAESSFHHLVDYNWDPRSGCPTFLTESPGSGYIDNPSALDDVKHYVTNLARWLSD